MEQDPKTTRDDDFLDNEAADDFSSGPSAGPEDDDDAVDMELDDDDLDLDDDEEDDDDVL